MIAGLEKESNALLVQVDGHAGAGVKPARTDASADECVICGNESIHTGVAPIIPNRLAHGARCHRRVLDLAISVVPATTADNVKAIASAFPVIHIVCG